MNFFELAKNRQSIRKFIDKDISDDIIEQLIALAQEAPSGGNKQDWFFYAVKNQDLKNRIVEESRGQSFIATAPVVFVVCADHPRTMEKYAERGRDLYSVQDTAAAIQNILLGVTNLGLGACWCGAFDEDGIKEVLNIKEGFRPIAVIPIGYYDSATNKPKRRDMAEIFEIIE